MPILGGTGKFLASSTATDSYQTRKRVSSSKRVHGWQSIDQACNPACDLIDPFQVEAESATYYSRQRSTERLQPKFASTPDYSKLV